jgi:hypothetical protein
MSKPAVQGSHALNDHREIPSARLCKPRVENLNRWTNGSPCQSSPLNSTLHRRPPDRGLVVGLRRKGCINEPDIADYL